MTDKELEEEYLVEKLAGTLRYFMWIDTIDHEGHILGWQWFPLNPNETPPPKNKQRVETFEEWLDRKSNESPGQENNNKSQASIPGGC